ncbi:MAG: hypothetical protein FJ317_03765 [SAR202 cluster bacterium]|nr:hypothetical protein [SAR202 cluster bacterium]
MPQPLTQMPKPDAGQYRDSRKLLLVPTFYTAPDPPEEVAKLLRAYWSEVRDQMDGLERSLGKIMHVYHESVFSSDDQGMQIVSALNPYASAFITALCRSSATLEATEDRAALEEGADWQRCIAAGLASEKVRNLAFDGYDEALRRRYEHIGRAINDTLKSGETGALFIVEHHKVQFPMDVQVFYVAPPTLDALKRWLEREIHSRMEHDTVSSSP